MKIEVHTCGASNPVTYYNVENAYQKGDFYCVIVANPGEESVVYKHPLPTIWRVVETYRSARPEDNGERLWLQYNRGPSSWKHTNCEDYPDGPWSESWIERARRLV